MERLQAYGDVVAAELNRMGLQGWELLQAPDQSGNRYWIFKRPSAA